MSKDNPAAKQRADLRSGAKGIKDAVRRQDWQAAMDLIQMYAPNAASAGHPELIDAWIQSLPEEFVQGSPELSYWSGINIVFVRPWEARPHLQRAFDLLRDGPCGNGVLLAWAGLLDAIFALYRDLRELDPLLDWMTLEREGIVDRMPPPLRSLVVGSALFAFAFRQPQHPRMGKWRDRAQKLFERDPVSDLGARLIAGLMTDYLWRGNIAEAEVLWCQFRARAARVRLTPLTDVSRYLSESTLRNVSMTLRHPTALI